MLVWFFKERRVQFERKCFGFNYEVWPVGMEVSWRRTLLGWRLAGREH